MLALVGAVVLVLLLHIPNKATLVEEVTLAPRPATVLQVVTAKAARLLDRAAMVLNQISAALEATPPILLNKATNKVVIKVVASNKEAFRKEVINRVATSTNP